jgi:hypothetical protein
MTRTGTKMRKWSPTMSDGVQFGGGFVPYAAEFRGRSSPKSDATGQFLLVAKVISK